MTRTIINVANRYDKSILSMPNPVKDKLTVIKQLIVIATATGTLGRCRQNGLVERVIKIVSIALKIK